MLQSTRKLHVDHTRRVVLTLCWVVLVLEGYDIVVFGAVVPSLLSVQEWGLTRTDVGLLGSVAVVGMGIGAFIAAWLGDRYCRRPLLVASVLTFSSGMAVCAAAPNPALFAVGRLAVGIGAGCLLPTVAVTVAEHVKPGRWNRDQGIVFCGIGVGGALSGLLSLEFAVDGGFRVMFIIGVLPAFVLVPVLLRWLPESLGHPITRGRADKAGRLRRYSINARVSAAASTERVPVGAGSWRFLLGPAYATRTLLFWATTFLSLLIVFGANTWLPVLMIASGYELGAALAFLLVLNLGLVGGSLVSAQLADRFGARRLIAISFTSAAAAFVLLALGPPLPVTYPLVAIVGAGATGTQLLVNAFIVASYPVTHRTTALGTALGVGRLGGVLGPVYGSWLLTEGFPDTLGFYGFALPALLAGLVITLVPGPQAVAQTRYATPE